MDTEPNPCRDIGKPCDLCCKIMAVPGLEARKPRHQWCPHCVHSIGCSIYQRRPEACASYECVWAISQHDPNQASLPLDLKPSVCGVVLNTTKDGKDLVADLNDGVDPHEGNLGTFLHNMSMQVRVFIRHRARMRLVIKGKLVADYQDDALMGDKDAENMQVKLLEGVKL